MAELDGRISCKIFFQDSSQCGFGARNLVSRINNMKKDDSVFYDVPIIFEQGGLKRGLFGEGG